MIATAERTVTLFLGKPQEKQKQFMTAKARYVCFGGARGGGKSWAVREKAKRLAVKWAGIKILIIRETFDDLKKNHINQLRLEIPPEFAKYREQEKTFTFFNGSIIQFAYFANDADANRYQGQEYDVIFLDEACQHSEHVFNVLKACNRGANNFPKRIYLTCNPDGKGFDWVKRLFITREFHENENPDDYVFIQSLVTDNPKLIESDKEYIKVLDSLPDEMRQRWRYGSWEAPLGQFFPDYKPQIHIYDPNPNEPIPREWRRYVAFDYGLDMLAVLWFAVSSTRDVYVYRELHLPNVIISDAATKILELSKDEGVYMNLAPPDLWSRSQESGRSRAEIFYENGLQLVKSSNDRAAGWSAVHELLKLSDTGEARLHIARSCENLRKNLAMLRRDEKNPDDAATEPHEITHICDALRYFSVWWIRPKPVAEARPSSIWTEDMKEDYYNASPDEKRLLIAKYGKPF